MTKLRLTDSEILIKKSFPIVQRHPNINKNYSQERALVSREFQLVTKDDMNIYTAF